MPPVVIIGTGGMGREAQAWVRDCGRGADLVGYLDDDVAKHGTKVGGLFVLGGLTWLEEHPDTHVVLAVARPAVRMSLLASLDRRATALTTLVHPSALIGPRVVLGDGCIVCPGVILTTDITVGRAAILNYGAMVGHDGVIGDAVFVAPGVHLAGNVTIEARADVGIGASVIQGVTIGAGARIGAGAVVIRDVAPHVIAVGVPARPCSRPATR